MAVIYAFLGILVACGVMLIAMGARRTVRRQRPIHQLLKRLPHWRWRSPLVRGTALAATGILVAVATGWVVAIVAVPMLGLGLPYLIGSSANATDINKLEAMEEWTRSLAGILTAGAGLEQALVSSLRSTPATLRGDVANLVARLRARWTTADAIRAFADDINDPTGDIIAANLLLGAKRRGDGLATILEGLAESVALDIRARRQVEADAAKPRSTARWVTIITTVVLVGLFFTGSYVAPYKSGLGQLILLGLLAAYGATLVWMRRMAAGTSAPRFLGTAAEGAAP